MLGVEAGGLLGSFNCLGRAGEGTPWGCDLLPWEGCLITGRPLEVPLKWQKATFSLCTWSPAT